MPLLLFLICLSFQGTLSSWRTSGVPLTYFNDWGVRQRFIFYTPKNPNFRSCLPKKIPSFVSIPKKILQCFCFSKFYYLSSGKVKHANFNFGFGQKQNYKLHLCYCWFELMKNTIPKKIPVLFSRPKKIQASFIDAKKSLLAKISDPKKSFGPPSLKYVSGAPRWRANFLVGWNPILNVQKTQHKVEMMQFRDSFIFHAS